MGRCCSVDASHSNTTSSVLQGSSEPCITAVEASSSILVSDGRKYFFDHVFGPDAPQPHVYSTAAKPLLLHFLEGYNCTIVAYGQTGSGKTYTMGTDVADAVPSQQQVSVGILPRLAHDLFQVLEDLEKRNVCGAGLRSGDPVAGGRGGFKTDVQCQFLEIYNNEIRDLLAEKPSKCDRRSAEVTLRECGRDIVVGGARRCQVPDVKSLMAVFQAGCGARTTGGLPP
jgi:hypothetical protein